ncbi:hypothetical protein HanLR1_Chr05g0179181 [Helianthus annuus]|nr:hypothetical protein HanHA89_Chr05g0189781 [Helianthus annuus]KAJ0750205.1 hypothetical protein HanLR1_Chr05g0179181 [Helianthus annuus]
MFYCCFRCTKPVAGKPITHSPQIDPPALPQTQDAARLIQLGHSRSLAATICSVRSHLTYPQPLARRTMSTAPDCNVSVCHIPSAITPHSDGEEEEPPQWLRPRLLCRL